ncbi:hypothetical protein Y049_3729 [Burkholderia pseudomallei MSHR684]|nr:hypothetical protein Y049_3729 [Burkholderia pseudomallei MSHR684]
MSAGRMRRGRPHRPDDAARPRIASTTTRNADEALRGWNERADTPDHRGPFRASRAESTAPRAALAGAPARLARHHRGNRDRRRDRRARRGRPRQSVLSAPRAAKHRRPRRARGRADDGRRLREAGRHRAIGRARQRLRQHRVGAIDDSRLRQMGREGQRRPELLRGFGIGRRGRQRRAAQRGSSDGHARRALLLPRRAAHDRGDQHPQRRPTSAPTRSARRSRNCKAAS